MFGLFTPKCPVDPAERIWVEQRMSYLAEVFSPDRMLRAQVVTPSADWFPDRYTESEDDVFAMFQQVCGFMDLDPDCYQLEIRPEEEFKDNPLGLYYHAAAGEKECVTVLSTEAGDPMSLVATIAHELAHSLLLGQRRLTTLAGDHEWVADLLTVFFGLGLFSANSVIRESYEHFGNRHVWQVRRRGYMSEVPLAYALALFAYAREERSVRWDRFLRPNVREPFRQSLRYLEKTDDSSFRRDNIARIGGADDGRPILEIYADIRSPSPRARLAAVWELQRRDLPAEDVIGPLTKLLHDRNPTVRREAADALGRRGSEAAAPMNHLFDMLCEPKPDDRVAALRAVGQIVASAEPIVPEIIRLLDDPENDVTFQAAVTLGNLGCHAAKAVPVLTRRLETLNNEIAAAAAVALGGIGSAAASAVEALIGVIDHGEGESRMAAAAALGKIGETSDTVVATLHQATSDGDVEVRYAAIHAMMELKLHDLKSVEVLNRAINDDDFGTRLWAARALSQLDGHAEAAVRCFCQSLAPPLSPPPEDQAIEFDASIHQFVIDAIGEMGGSAVPSLIRLLEEPDPAGRAFAAWALGKLGKEAVDAAGPLEARVEADDRLLRLLSAFALWNVARRADVPMRVLIDELIECDLTQPLEAVFDVCEVGPQAVDRPAYFAGWLPGPGQLVRAAIRVAVREMGPPAAPPLAAVLPTADPQLAGEVTSMLAAIGHTAGSAVLEEEAGRVQHDLATRKLLTDALNRAAALAEEAHRYELMTVTLPQRDPAPPPPPPDAAGGPILAATRLLVEGLANDPAQH